MKATKEQESFILKNYPDYGFEICMATTGLSKIKIARIARKYGLKLNRELIRRLRSEANIKDIDEYKVCHLPFENIEREEEAYILGLLWTDGHVSKKTNSISFATTCPDSDHFEKVFNKTGNWAVYRGKKKEKESHKQRIQITTNNKFLRDFLAENGFAEKEKGLDRILRRIPEIFLPAFFAGLIDGDGCFYVNKEKGIHAFTLCSCYEQDWECILSFIRSKGINCSVCKNISPCGSSSKIYISGHKFVSLFGQFVYQGTSLGLPRKKAKFLQIEERYKFPPPRKRRRRLP